MSHIQIRISDQQKKEVKAVLDDLGLNYSSAIKLFFDELTERGEMPFSEGKTYISDPEDAPVTFSKRMVVEATEPQAKSWNPFTVHKIG